MCFYFLQKILEFDFYVTKNHKLNKCTYKTPAEGSSIIIPMNMSNIQLRAYHHNHNTTRVRTWSLQFQLAEVVMIIRCLFGSDGSLPSITQ